MQIDETRARIEAEIPETELPEHELEDVAGGTGTTLVMTGPLIILTTGTPIVITDTKIAE